MSEWAVQVEQLGKRYRVGRRAQHAFSYRALRDILADGLAAPFRRRAVKADTPDTFWALREVSFGVRHGEVLGVVGRNGAGKSTLLKILSRITEPTEGQVYLRGRVGSLLEVGTGFHPELTGRENIFLNGAIMGMQKAEITRKFEEIVEFAEVTDFLDTPVKRYSSGMYVRLAFAVAAHLEPEILLVDEVLAVGDATFQKKCLGKMDEVARGGRTVLFVSHNLPMMSHLCKQGLLIEQGHVVAHDQIDTVIAQYEKSGLASTFEPIALPEVGVRIDAVMVNDGNGAIKPYDPLVITIDLSAERALSHLALNLTIGSARSSGFVFSTSTKPHQDFTLQLQPGPNRVRCVIPKVALCSGVYQLGFGVAVPMVETLYFNPVLLSFEIGETLIPGSTLRTVPEYGLFYMDHQWEQG